MTQCLACRYERHIAHQNKIKMHFVNPAMHRSSALSLSPLDISEAGFRHRGCCGTARKLKAAKISLSGPKNNLMNKMSQGSMPSLGVARSQRKQSWAEPSLRDVQPLIGGAVCYHRHNNVPTPGEFDPIHSRGFLNYDIRRVMPVGKRTLILFRLESTSFSERCASQSIT